jgi:hypothetical protein
VLWLMNNALLLSGIQLNVIRLNVAMPCNCNQILEHSISLKIDVLIGNKPASMFVKKSIISLFKMLANFPSYLLKCYMYFNL